MQITEHEIRQAVGHHVIIQMSKPTDGGKFVEVTDTPGHLWKCDTEEEAKKKLLEEIARRAADCKVIIFRIWPESGSRPDGKCSGYTRANFS